MTAPVRRRPLPALALIAALLVLTAFVWFRVIHRGDTDPTPAARCPTPSSTAPVQRPSVLPYPKQVSVLLLNSTQRIGLARSTRKPLHKRGFTITATDDDSAKYGGRGLIRGVAEIRYGRRAYAAATLLSYYFPKASLRLTSSANTVVIVSLGRQFRAIASPTAVAAALTRAGDRLSSKAPSPTPSPTSSSPTC